MKLIFMIFLYVLANVFIILSIISFIEKYSKYLNNHARLVLLILYLVCASSVIFGYIMPLSNVQKIVQGFANYFIGFIIYIAMSILLFDLILLILKIAKKRNKRIEKNIFLSLLIVFFTFALYGFFHAKEITIVKYDVKVSKDIKEDMKIALISDTHLGYSIGYKMMQDMVKKINNENVDLVLIAGDIFDNSDKTVDDMKKVKEAFSNIKSKFGVYAVFGNHDVEERLFGGFSVDDSDEVYITEEMRKMLESCNINILEDKSVLINDNIYIIGRKDIQKAGDGTSKRLQISELMNSIDKNKLVILLEHEPRELMKTSNYGVDIHLSGHTHAGQFFPLTIGCKLMSENVYGVKKYNDMVSLVTSGIGVYGPNMRVATNSEVCILNIYKNSNLNNKENYIWKKK